jgi:bifunctional non-homologous end joining protein LigD
MARPADVSRVGARLGTTITRSMSAASDQLTLELAATPTRLPSDLRPMLPKAAPEPFDDPEWLFEPDWDGRPVLAFVEGSRMRLVDPRGRDLAERFPELLGLIDAVNAAPTILAGQVVVTDASGRPDGDALRRRLWPEQGGRVSGRGEATFLANDVLVSGGRSLLRTPLAQRRRALDSALGPTTRAVIVPSVAEDGTSLFAAIDEQGLPAMLARRLDSPYLPGVRSDLWRSIRTTLRFDAVIGGFNARIDGTVTLLLGAWTRPASGEPAFVAIAEVKAPAGTPLAAALQRPLPVLATPVTPFSRGARAEYRWVRPELVVSVEHDGWSEGRLLGARLVAIRDELEARGCRLPPQPTTEEDGSNVPSRPVLALLQRLPLAD